MGHHAHRILIASIVAVIVLNFTYFSITVPGLLVECALVVLVLYTWFALKAHDRRLCSSCVSALPLDPAARADRFSTRLRFTHRFENKVFSATYLVVLLGSNSFTILLPDLYGRIPWAVAQSSMIYLALCYNTHKMLQPWCPQCKNGGDPIFSTPDPRPVTSNL